MRITLVANI